MALPAKRGIAVIAATIACPDRSTFEGSGPINVNYDAGNGVVIRAVNVHLQADPSTAEDLIVKQVIPSDSPKFDVCRFKQDMQGVADIVLTDPIYLSKGDRLVIDFPNADNISWGITLIHGSNSGG